MESSTFKEMIDGGLTVNDIKIQVFMNRLKEHGEVMVVTADGAEFAMHLGDKGNIEQGIITLVDREGQRWNIFTDQIVNIRTHRGYKEGG